MSVDYTFYAIFGVEFSTNTERFRAVERVPNCDHPQVDGAKFCPSCGTKVGFHTDVYTTDAFDHLCNAMSGGLPKGFVGIIDNDRKVCVVGYGRTWDKYSSAKKSKMPPPEDQIKTTLSEILEPFGGFTDEQFGFHTGYEAR